MRSLLPCSTDHAVDRAAPRRRMTVNRLIVAAWLIAIAADSAMAQPSKKAVIEEKTLTTDDNVELKATYFKSTSGKDAPVIIMLHGKGGSRRQYKAFATELQVKGDFAVITVDLRGHGDSQQTKKGELKKTDYTNMVTNDMEAVRDFIFDEHQKEQLNMNKQGIVACEFSASVALTYTEMDWDKKPFDDSPVPGQGTPRGQDVRALALISPDISTPGLLAGKAAGIVRTFPIAVMIGAAEKDKIHDLASSKKLYDQFLTKRGEKEDNMLYFSAYPEAARGMDLIVQDPTVRAHITAFLTKHVKEFHSEWRDRRSRLDRE